MSPSVTDRDDSMLARATATAATDSGMEHFGYRESLARSIGGFGSFAAGVSYISILTGTFQLFYFGFGTAGPAYLWSWPMVVIIRSMAERALLSNSPASRRSRLSSISEYICP